MHGRQSSLNLLLQAETAGNCWSPTQSLVWLYLIRGPREQEQEGID